MSKRKNGEGSFEHLPDGRVRMRKQIGYTNSGNPKRITVTGNSETDCLKKMRKREQTEVFPIEKPKQKTLTDLCYDHFYYDLNRDKLKPKSADRREGTIKNQIQIHNIGQKKISTVTGNDIQNHIHFLLDELKFSVSSVEKTLDVINAAYKWAYKKGLYYSNPCVSVLDDIKEELKKRTIKNSSDGIVIVLSDKQLDLITTHVTEMLLREKKYRVIWGLSIIFLVETGIRIGELCFAKWGCWSRKSNSFSIYGTRNIAKNRKAIETIYQPNENSVKNYHSRTIQLNEKAAEVLNIIFDLTPKKEKTDYILVNSKYTPTNPSNFDTNINKLYREIGLPADVTGCHILRRTCATKMHNEGCSTEDIAAYLGDLPETIRKHYLCLTQRIVSDGEVINIVKYPQKK